MYAENIESILKPKSTPVPLAPRTTMMHVLRTTMPNYGINELSVTSNPNKNHVTPTSNYVTYGIFPVEKFPLHSCKTQNLLQVIFSIYL